MKRISRTLVVCIAVSACAASTAALADNPIGFYIGAGAGYSTVRSDDPSFGYPGYFNDNQIAWKGIVGVRPIPFLGAEFEYIDFGQPDVHSGYYDTRYYGYDSHPRASALFAVGYLPIPVPFFDIFGKAGVAHLQTDITSTSPCTANQVCTQIVPTPLITSRHEESENKFAYGIGVQSKFWGVAFRAEYERISSSFGDPDALTVSATWTF